MVEFSYIWEIASRAVNKTGSSVNEFVGTSLITMYSECGDPDCLMRVFNDFDHRNVASWNALISGFVLNGCIHTARDIFDCMPFKNVVSWTALINGYLEIKRVRNAMELFSLMPAKNIVTWVVMLGGLVSDGQYEETLALFTDMLRSGIRPNVSSLLKVISASSGLKNPKRGRQVHGNVVKLGFGLNPSFEASLVTMYSRCLSSMEVKLILDKMDGKFIGTWNSLICGCINNDKIDEARKLFNEMRERDEISWNSLIKGYLRVNRISDALKLFLLMRRPTIHTYTVLISGFVDNGRITEARRLFDIMPIKDVTAYTSMLLGHIEDGALEVALDLFQKMPRRNVITYNVMISGLARHGMVTKALEIFSEFPRPDIIAWNTLVTSLVQSGFNGEAFLLFHRMILSGVNPNESAIASLVSSSANLSSYGCGESLHGFAIKYGLICCVIVGNSLISMYAKCGDMSTAQTLFDQLDKHDLVTWNAMIHGYAINGFGKKGIEMFEKMVGMEIKPDGISFLGVLCACMHTRLLEKAKYYFHLMRHDYAIEPDLTHYTCIIDLLCRNGLLKEAEALIYSMPFHPDMVIWTSFLSRCRLNGTMSLAEHAAKQLFRLLPGDPMPYLHLGEIYRSAGRWSQLENLRNKISKRGINKKLGRSWIEMNG